MVDRAPSAGLSDRDRHFAVLRPLPISDRDKDAEILALRHQITLLQHQLGPSTVTFTSADWAFLAAISQPLPRLVLRRRRLVIRPDTRLRWHRNLMKHRMIVESEDVGR